MHSAPANILYVPTDQPLFFQEFPTAVLLDPKLLLIMIQSDMENDVVARMLQAVSPITEILNGVWLELTNRKMVSIDSLSGWNPAAGTEQLRAQLLAKDEVIRDLKNQLRDKDAMIRAQDQRQPVAATAPAIIGFEDGPGYEALYRHQNNPDAPVNRTP